MFVESKRRNIIHLYVENRRKGDWTERGTRIESQESSKSIEGRHKRWEEDLWTMRIFFYKNVTCEYHKE